MASPDPLAVGLSEAESRRIFREQIAPRYRTGPTTGERPVVVFVAGQPGAGTSKAVSEVAGHLRMTRGTPVTIRQDEFQLFHPDADRLLQEHGVMASDHTRLDEQRWQRGVADLAMQDRSDVVIETTMSSPAAFQAQVEQFRAAGYSVEVQFVATPEQQSRLAVLERYEMEVAQLGYGRLTPRAEYEASVRGVGEVAALIDQGVIPVEYASVVGRDGTPVPRGNLFAPAPLHATIVGEQHRPWTQAETQAFADRVSALSARMGPAWLPELHSLVVAAGPYAHRSVPPPVLGGPAPPPRTAPTVAGRAFRGETRDVLAALTPDPRPDPIPLQASRAAGRGIAPER